MKFLFPLLFCLPAVADPLLAFVPQRLISWSGDASQSRDCYAWHFENTGQPSSKYVNGTFDSQLPASTNCGPRIGQLTVDCSGVVVGVLDTGCNTNHPDLSGVVLTNTTAGLTDASGHGTRMCGLIAARQNEIGSRGVAQGCKLAVAKISLLTPSQVSTGISNLLDMQARVICFAWGLPRPEPLVYEAFKEAHRRGVLVVCAAQNTQVNYDGGVEDYPTLWKHELDNIVTVFCEMPDGRNLPGASAYGTNWIDFGAPGWALPAPDLADGYWYGNGTSEACAVATGVSALLIAQYPTENYRQTITRLRSTVRKSSDPFAAATISGGSIDAVAASEYQFPTVKLYVQTSADFQTWTELPGYITAQIESSQQFIRLRVE